MDNNGIMRASAAVAAAFLVLCVCPQAFTASKYVINVPGDCKSISEAVERSLPGDTILVGEGEYREKDGFTLKGNTKLVGAGADKTFLAVSGKGILLSAGVDGLNNVMIKGLFIKLASEPVALRGVDGFILQDCIVTCSGILPGLEIASSKNVKVINCDFVNNKTGISFSFGPVEAVIKNCIFYNNKVGIAVEPTPVASYARGEITGEKALPQQPRSDLSIVLAYNDHWNLKDFDDCKKGDNDIFQDPKFSNPSKDDYRLKDKSPCIDAGDPDLKYNDPDGSRNDIGALPSAGKKKN